MNQGFSIEGLLEIELVALAVKDRGVRCRLLTGESVTLKPSRQIWHEVAGQILKIKPNKLWKYAGTSYLSGELLSSRISIEELDLTPLLLESHGTWTPKEDIWGEKDEEVNPYFVPVIQAGPRPMFEMEQIIPGEDPEDPWDDPILQASEHYECGDYVSAYKIMEKILTTDLRCLDAHSHLGNWDFNSEPANNYRAERAKLHYEIGVKIGEHSLGPNFNGVLKWGMVDNRPFLRCLHGYGLCLWRLGEISEARKIFDRMIWLNPTDNQGIRFLLESIDAGEPWDEFQEKESS
ncbi:MAG: hypothetical protein ABIQ95_00480 [Bdellovibrionia bacterium]